MTEPLDPYDLYEQLLMPRTDFLEMIEEYCPNGGFLFGDQFVEPPLVRSTI